jgi:methyl-accepting chemotaxis protein
MMKLRNKMALCMILVFLVFTVALGVAISGMRNATSHFESFIDHDQAFLSASTSSYAQGLQMGQALRNVILAPENATGYKNLAAARKEFRQSLAEAQRLAADDATVSRTLAQVASVHERQAALQDALVGLAKQDQAAAIAKLNAEETPLWREMRGQMLDLIKAKNAALGEQKSALAQQSQRALTYSLVLGAIAMLAGGAISFWLTRDIMRRLGGEPAYAAEIASAIAAGDLTARIEVDDEANQASLIYAMRRMQQSLAALVQQVRTGTDTITTASGEIAAGNLDLSSRTEQQASALEETAASMEELTGTVQHNGENVRQANELAATASSVAAKGGAAVAQVVHTMGSINESSRRIVDIIGVIDGIAFQTNILALNAAVEAARAGDQGRGFAVVASEVRALAQRSAAAAKEIKDLIGESVDKVEAGSKLVNTAGTTMDEVVDSVKRFTAIMQDIALAGQEQSSGIAQVSQAITQMDQVTQQNAALVEEAAAAAHAMQEQASALLQVVSTFRVAEDGARQGRLAAPARQRLALGRSA